MFGVFYRYVLIVLHVMCGVKCCVVSVRHYALNTVRWCKHRCIGGVIRLGICLNILLLLLFFIIIAIIPLLLLLVVVLQYSESCPVCD